MDATRTLNQYPWPVIAIDCPRCRRHAEARVPELRAKYGSPTLGELARQVAASRGCALAADAGNSLCSARMVEPPVHHWATLDNAKRGGWAALLHCERHFAALKATKPCREAVELDVATLITVLGHDFPLERLPRRLLCPSCGTKSVRIAWIVPREPPAPGGASAPAEPLRLRPTKAALGRKRFRVVEGGN